MSRDNTQFLDLAAPATAKTLPAKTLKQIGHCEALITKLENVWGVRYNHAHYANMCGTQHCALGWAAVENIGGLKNPDRPRLGVQHGGYPESAADIVFGHGAFNRIFTPDNGDGFSRKDAIQALHEQIDFLREGQE